MKVFVKYPTKDEEKTIMRRMAKTEFVADVKPVFTLEDIASIRRQIDAVQVSGKLEDYIIDIVMATREPEQYGLERLAEYIEYGASPRASLALNLGSKAYAFLAGRNYVLPEDVKAIAPDVLNHRIILSYEAESEEITSMACIQQILKTLNV
ncbi:MAG: MoxR family ATPase, partial [Bacteroidia bacterium]|nr:MoxR family ATPase [Bacteroidia bacterium]